MSGMADDLTPHVESMRRDVADLASVTDTEALFTLGDYQHLGNVARNRLHEEQQKSTDYRRLLAAAVDAAGGELRFDLDDMDLLKPRRASDRDHPHRLPADGYRPPPLVVSEAAPHLA